jgi:DNA-binding HxlR family transcriptional regulator
MHDTSSAVITPEHRELLGQVLDRWSLQVVDELCESPRRFNDLRRAVPDVSQKSLTTTLRRLERNGMVERRVLTTRPVAVEYHLTPLAHSVQTLVDDLYRWSTASLPEVARARDAFDARDDE